MKFRLYFAGIVIFTVSCVSGTGQSCQDIDHAACVDMATQNTNMCSDPVLRNSACPRYCNSCPLTCYTCNISTADATSCNTATCGNDQACMTKAIKSMNGRMHRYTLACEKISVCNGNRRRSLKSRSVYVDCCRTDWCNDPKMTTISTISLPSSALPTTTAPMTTAPPVTKSSPTTALHLNGQWTEWSSWGDCIRGLGDITVMNRTRVCIKPSPSVSCSGGEREVIMKSCVCTAPEIISINVMGTWKLNEYVELQCVTQGNPKPSIEWFSTQLGNYRVLDSRLEIGPITPNTPRHYRCKASNTCGTKYQVYSRPDPPTIVG